VVGTRSIEVSLVGSGGMVKWKENKKLRKKMKSKW
jgi:hypothetical protein